MCGWRELFLYFGYSNHHYIKSINSGKLLGHKRFLCVIVAEIIGRCKEYLNDLVFIIHHLPNLI